MYLSYVKSIAPFTLTFFGYIISVLASVLRVSYMNKYLCNIQTEPLYSFVNISIIFWIQTFMQSQTGIVNWYWDMFRLDQSSKKRRLPKSAIFFLKHCYSYSYICPHRPWVYKIRKEMYFVDKNSAE